MRKLKFHEKKLLKKVNFFHYKKEHNVRQNEVLRRYHIQRPEDYRKYNKLCGVVKKIVQKISKLDSKDPFRKSITDQLLEKLFNMGIIADKSSITSLDNITASAFCRRRLAVILVRMKMAENLKEATTFIEQGRMNLLPFILNSYVRIGPEVIQDPSVHISRPFEDLITWVDNSKIKKQILKYNDRLDDFDLM